MTAVPQALQYQEFDTKAFGIPFYRIVDPRLATFEDELAALASEPPLIVDAKLPAHDIETGARLLRLGFRKICVQAEFEHSLGAAVGFVCVRAEIRDRIVFPEAVIDAHARQFVFDRFALDAELPAGGHDRLYKKWIRNSLENGGHSVAVAGENFITYKLEAGIIRIDLVSVLCRRRGIGLDLLHTIMDYGRKNRVDKVVVVTECENLPAMRLYAKAGFAPARLFSAFHLVRKT